MIKRKLYKTLLSCICLTAILSTGGAMSSHAAITNRLEPIRIHGPITKTQNGELSIDNQSGQGYEGEIRLSISNHTRILDAVTGLPVAYDSLKDGETAYVYIGAAMTLSLPPLTNAGMVLCNIPADYKVPDYLKVETLTLNSDGTSGSIKATNGSTYTIPADAQIFPYLTRNIVTIHDLSKGATCLLWSDADNRASKVMIFPASTASQEPELQTGWVKKGDVWYYFDENGVLFTGWLEDNDSWYYLQPSTGIMQTGFLTLEGKTYYFQEDGKMLTKAKMFTPDENGVLH